MGIFNHHGEDSEAAIATGTHVPRTDITTDGIRTPSTEITTGETTPGDEAQEDKETSHLAGGVTKNRYNGGNSRQTDTKISLKPKDETSPRDSGEASPQHKDRGNIRGITTTTDPHHQGDM